MEQTYKCEGWVIRSEAGVAEGPQGEPANRDFQMTFESPDGQTYEPFLLGSVLPATKFRRWMTERGVSENCADEVLAWLELS